jgi:hypothetical protein
LAVIALVGAGAMSPWLVSAAPRAAPGKGTGGTGARQAGARQAGFRKPGSGQSDAGQAEALDRGIQVKVKRGDSAEELATRYYGGTWAARPMLVANGENGLGRRLPRLRPGRTLHLPTAWSYRIRLGDTWTTISRDYLGDGSRARFLAELNEKRYRSGVPAPAGHVISIPALLSVRVPRRLGLRGVASRLLDRSVRDPQVRRLVKRIRRYNGLKGRARVGRRLVVPLASLRLLGWYLPNALPRPDPGLRRRARPVIRQARADLRRGRYLAAAMRLGPLLGWKGLPERLRVLALRLRCTAWVALGREGLALESAREALRIRPGLSLDPVRVSPKVRAVFARAKRAGGPRVRPRTGN